MVVEELYYRIGPKSEQPHFSGTQIEIGKLYVKTSVRLCSPRAGFQSRPAPRGGVMAISSVFSLPRVLPSLSPAATSRVMGWAVFAYGRPGTEPVHPPLYHIRVFLQKIPKFLSLTAPLPALCQSLSTAGLIL